MEITNLFIKDYNVAVGKLQELYKAVDDYRLVFRSAEFRLKGLWEKNKDGKMPPFNQESYWRGRVYEEVRDWEKKLEEAYRDARRWCSEVDIALPFTFDDLKYWVEHPAEDEWITQYGRI